MHATRTQTFSSSFIGAAICAALSAALAICATCTAFAEAGTPQETPSSGVVFKTSVRRVLVDVVVTDATGKPVPGLSRSDFSVAEDGNKQRILSFDAHQLEPISDTALPKAPVLPANTYLSLPRLPERGPLYILLFDMLNTEVADQMTVRGQLTKFIQSMEPGTRFAVFVLSDSLYMAQGFTSDRDLLYASIDPHREREHVPSLFLYGANYGAGDQHAMVDVFNYIGKFVDGLPGRKNLIWLSGSFPMRLSPTTEDTTSYAGEIKETLDTLARNQVSVYPVDSRGVIAEVTSQALSSESPSGSGFSGIGSELTLDYDTEDQIALATGGHAFYGQNDVAGTLLAATNRGANYYTLSYSPSNQNYNGKLRMISVRLARKGYSLSYRRGYYSTDDALRTLVAGNRPGPAQANSEPVPGAAKAVVETRPIGDSLGVEMQFGAPMAHDLLFKAHVHPLGPAAMATPEQMADLSDEPAYFRARRKNKPLKPLPPVMVQRFAIDYTLPGSQVRLQTSAPGLGPASSSLELAVASFDAEGRMVNGTVHNAFQDAGASQAQPAEDPKPAAQAFYRVQQQIDVPLSATSIRIAVRDMTTDRLGTIDVPLPLANEADSASIAKPDSPERQTPSSLSVKPRHP